MRRRQHANAGRWGARGLRAGTGGLAAGLLAAAVVWAQTPRIPDPSQDVTRGITTSISRNIEAAVVKPELVVRKPVGTIVQLGLSPDDRTLTAVHAKGEVRTWDLVRGVQRPGIVAKGAKARVATALGDANGVLVGFDDGSVRLFDATTGVETANLGRHRKAVSAVAVSADGTRALSGAEDGSLRLFDLASRAELGTVTAPGGAVAAVAVSALGTRALVSTADGALSAWDHRTAALRPLGQPGKVLALRFVRDARGLAVATPAGRLATFDLDSGAQTAAVETNRKLSAAAFSPDGKRAALAPTDGGLDLVDVATGGVLRTMGGRPTTLRGVGFALHDARVVSGDAEGTVRVWDAESGESLVQAFSTEAGWAVIDRQGRFDGSEQGMRDVGWKARDRELDLDSFAGRFFEPGLLATSVEPGRRTVTDAPGAVPDGIALPPKVEIDVPKESQAARAAGQPYQIVVVAEDQGGGIDEVRLYHNGKLVVPGALVQQQDVEQNGRRLRAAAFRVNPVAGVNTLRGVATGQWGIEGESQRVTLEFQGTSGKPVLHLLAVGVDRYADKSLNLDYAVRDSGEFVKGMREDAGSSYSDVQVQELHDTAATRERILSSLRSLADAPSEDVLVIYLAGHGRVSGDDWIFLPHDARPGKDAERSGIRAAELREALVQARAQRVLVLIDSCESGAAVVSFEEPQRFERRYLREISRLAGVSIIGATRQDQLAAELEQLGHGVFTYVILRGLGGDADRDPKDGLVTAHELVAYSALTTPDVARRYIRNPQEPMAFMLGADFSLVRVERRGAMLEPPWFAPLPGRDAGLGTLVSR